MENEWANDTDRYALAAHPGKSQGPPPKSTGSQPIVHKRRARLRSPQQESPVPGKPLVRDRTGDSCLTDFHAPTCASQPTRLARCFFVINAITLLRPRLGGPPGARQLQAGGRKMPARSARSLPSASGADCRSPTIGAVVARALVATASERHQPRRPTRHGCPSAPAMQHCGGADHGRPPPLATNS